jgi:hypothetical protein
MSSTIFEIVLSSVIVYSVIVLIHDYYEGENNRR